jgi:DNA-binding GntR family transcriptional regulator
MLGVSIVRLREAVSRLVADKALEVTPNRAARVPPMSVGLRQLSGGKLPV